MAQSQLDFIQQQGFAQTDIESGDGLYSALMFQPRVVGIVVLTGIVFQDPAVFVTLSAVLWWSAFVPRHNPFDELHNRLIARRWHHRPLHVAPPPRRFAQGLAATLAFGIAGALRLKSTTTAWVLEAILGSAAAGVVFGRFCAGSYLYHLLSFCTRCQARARGSR
jgi:hypothetical protein